jgi:hypothetical protein
VNETSEDLRQKLAALVANMSVQEDRVRNLLCRDEVFCKRTLWLYVQQDFVWQCLA